MKIPLPTALRSVAFWQKVWIVTVIATSVILASMALVTFRNRDRGATEAVVRALVDIGTTPDTVVSAVYAPSLFKTAVDGFLRNVKESQLHVDSIRVFYHAYSLRARDGDLDAADIALLGPYFGLLRRTPPAPEDSVSVTNHTDSGEVRSE